MARSPRARSATTALLCSLLALGPGASAQSHHNGRGGHGRGAGNNPPDAGAVDPNSPGARLAAATVTVLVDGSPAELGVALARDGRVLTAASPLADARRIAVRFSDGTTEGATNVSTDGAWGTALLQPAGARWPQGLDFEPDADAMHNGAAVVWASGAARPGTVAGAIDRRHSYVGPGGALLRDGWDLAPDPGSGAVGAGIVGPGGALVGLVVPPSVPASQGGARGPFGAPAGALASLVDEASDAARPWLGIVARDLQPGEGGAVNCVGGAVVTDVAPGSPASRAGVRAGTDGDVVVGVDDDPVRSLAELNAALDAHHAGDTVQLHVTRAGARLDFTVTLERRPRS